MQVPQPQKRQVLNVNCVNLLITLYLFHTQSRNSFVKESVNIGAGMSLVNH